MRVKSWEDDSLFNLPIKTNPLGTKVLGEIEEWIPADVCSKFSVQGGWKEFAL